MLLAQPCDWTDWRRDRWSKLTVLRFDDRRTWTEVGEVGPWAPPGVMWQVPLLVRTEAGAALILSVVDRRRGTADCSVRYWSGTFDGAGFQRDAGQPDDGRLLDLGPDF